MRRLIADERGSWYPVAMYVLIVLAGGLVYYLLSDTAITFIGYTSGAMATFFSVFWKAVIILILLVGGVWMLVYMQRLRRFEYE